MAPLIEASRKANLEKYTVAVSHLLENPTKLASLLDALHLPCRHYPDNGVFLGRCPSCGMEKSLYVRYTQTERSPYVVFWTCRNTPCRQKGRHSSLLGLVRLALGLRLTNAATWLSHHLGFQSAHEVIRLPRPKPTQVAVIVDQLAKVRLYDKPGNSVFYVTRNKLVDATIAIKFERFARVLLDTDFNEVARVLIYNPDLDEGDLPAEETVSSVDPVDFKPIGKVWEYRVGSDGTILRRNKYCQTWHVVPQKFSKDGRPFVELSIRGKVRRYRLDRLVLKSFVGASPAGTTPGHRDGQLGNNRAENLFWREEEKRTNKGERHGRSKLKDADIVEIFTLHAGGLTRTAIAKQKGVSLSSVSQIISRKTWSHVPIPELPSDPSTFRKSY